MPHSSQHRHPLPRPRRGFSLLEIILALFILGLLTGALAPALRDAVETRQRDRETTALQELAGTITASFDSPDLTNLNLAAFTGMIGTSDTPTTFSLTTASPAVSAANDWFTKLARWRGLTPVAGGALSAQPEVSNLVFNRNGRPRYLFAAPSETERQRFLLVSLTARADQLVLPAYEATAAWFDALWATDWDSRTSAPPVLWQSKLTAAQWTAWNSGKGGMTQCSRLCVRRITLPKYKVTVNANHPTDKGFLSYNNTAPALTVNAASGATTTPAILSGRSISINRGAAYPGTEVLRFTLKENATVTLQ